MRTAPPAGVVLLMLLVLTRFHGDARPRLHGNRCFPPGETLLETLSLLRNVGSTFPSDCYNFNHNVTLPQNISTNHSQCSSALRLAHEALRGVGLVFEEQEPNLGVGGVLWDERKLDDFQNLLYQVLDHPCFSQMDSSRVLEQYFRDVVALIQKQGVCGWYILRRDLLWILRRSMRRSHHCYSWTRL